MSSKMASLDDLLMVAALALEQEGEPLTFENLVARCFKLFPARFSMRGYPQWPDSNVVNKSWLRARSDKHWLGGSVREGFRLTPDGRRHARRVQQASVANPVKAVDQERRTREGRLLQALRATAAFQKFEREGRGVRLDLAEAADALLASEDTSVKTLVRNAAQFRAAAQIYADADVEEFLNQVDVVLDEQRRQAREGYAGGMMQRKAEKHEDRKA